MKAFTKTKYRGPEVLRLEEVARPTLKDGHILVKIKANSANPADWHIIRGKPFFARFAFGLFKPNGIINLLGHRIGIDHKETANERNSAKLCVYFASSA